MEAPGPAARAEWGALLASIKEEASARRRRSITTGLTLKKFSAPTTTTSVSTILHTLALPHMPPAPLTPPEVPSNEPAPWELLSFHDPERGEAKEGQRHRSR
jgi:hypothetical protein